MKIAVPLTAADEFSPHYGAAAKFAVYDVDPGRRVVIGRTVVVPQEPEPCAWPPLLRTAGVEVVLAGGMGRGAQARMAELGLSVLAGILPAAPDTLVAAWLAGRLSVEANRCDGSGHGGRHHPGAHAHDDGHCHCAR